MRNYRFTLSLPKRIVLSLSVIGLLFTVTSCGKSNEDKTTEEQPTEQELLTEPQVDIDLQTILEKDTLTAITAFSTTSYFIYRGQQMGYEYELLQRFADHLGVELNMVLAKDLDRLFKMLNSGKGDVIAYSLTVTPDRKERVEFTVPHNHVKQVLVQRKPKNWRYMRQHQIDQNLIRNPLNLEGDTVYVRKNSAYYTRMKNLEEEIGGEIHIVQADSQVETEQLIKWVSEGKIDYTVADENIASVNQTYYDNIDVKTELSFPQKIAWAVRKNSLKLKDTLNDWISSMKGTTVYNVIYNKYYKNRRASQKRRRSAFFTLTTNQISEFDPLFKKYAEELPYDWLLLAALSYQESRFNPRTRSWAGAKGLMQLMPATAGRYGITNLYNPESSVRAGTKYIKWLDQKIWADKIKDPGERRKFVLASYNAGPGHVLDARRLTRKYDGDPNLWKNVSEYLLKKAKPKYYNDEVSKYGYCRGSEPYKYVNEIMSRYKHYKRFLKQTGGEDEEPETPTQQASLLLQ